jgi:hypothetical protein
MFSAFIQRYDARMFGQEGEEGARLVCATVFHTPGAAFVDFAHLEASQADGPARSD